MTPELWDVMIKLGIIALLAFVWVGIMFHQTFKLQRELKEISNELRDDIGKAIKDMGGD